MATEKTFSLSYWYGLNESEDGDTKLKIGEASICQNWKVTRDKVNNRSGGNLRRRYGTKTLWTLGTNKINGLWCGFINGVEHMIAVTDNKAYELSQVSNSSYHFVEIGNVQCEDRCSFFPFSNILYILTGKEYYQYDGSRITMVVGYRPLVATTTPPAGGGTLLEQVNKLNGLRRQWFSPDGTSTEFQLAEIDLVSIDYVKNNSDDSYVSPSTYTVNRSTGKVTFTTAPTNGTNTIEIGYTAASTYREEVTKMRFFELYAGQTSTRVLIYGDGSNKFLYSSMDYWGQMRADYFPDLNETALGDENTKITGMVRHYSNLIVFKEDDAYSLQYSLTEDSEGDEIESFYGKTINSSVGNVADGMVLLVENSPRTLCGNDAYEWKNTSAYSSNLTIDERQAKRISDRIFSTLESFTLKKCYCYNDRDNQEYYICNPETKEALVNNYVTDTWYKYTNFDMLCACNYDGDIYFGTQDGKIKRFSADYYNDDGTAIVALWQSGSMAFEAPQMRKFMSRMFVTIKPESHGFLRVSAITDKKAVFKHKEVESSLFDFGDVDFTNISFETNRMPKTHRVKLKAKKFVYMCIILETDDDDSSATVTDITIPVRYSGYAK